MCRHRWKSIHIAEFAGNNQVTKMKNEINRLCLINAPTSLIAAAALPTARPPATPPPTVVLAPKTRGVPPKGPVRGKTRGVPPKCSIPVGPRPSVVQEPAELVS
jgi:hypothetical protein